MPAINFSVTLSFCPLSNFLERFSAEFIIFITRSLEKDRVSFSLGCTIRQGTRGPSSKRLPKILSITSDFAICEPQEHVIDSYLGSSNASATGIIYGVRSDLHGPASGLPAGNSLQAFAHSLTVRFGGGLTTSRNVSIKL